MGPKIRISTIRIAPVGRVLPTSASASLPLEGFCAMIPEPEQERRAEAFRKGAL
jgi:hypothetical protein